MVAVAAEQSLFICDHCDGELKQKRFLMDHMRNVHAAEECDRLICDVCSTELKSKSHLPHHIRTRHQHVRAFKCQSCDVSFLAIGDLHRHQTQHQSIRFECDHCGKLVALKHNLSAHITSAHLKRCDQKLPECVCGVCGAKYNNYAALKVHKTDKHEKQLQCDLCDAKFGRKTVLGAHCLAVHLKLRQFKCDQCPVASCDTSSLRKHKLSAHRRTALVCDVCSTSFAEIRSLTGHYFAIHMDLKIYKCSLCGHSLPNRRSLTLHRKVHC